MSSSHAAAPPPPQIERAWHLLTVLVRFGRPASPAELAARCVLPPAMSPSPDLVEHLCSIPNSPLLLTEDRFVTAAESAVEAMLGFVSGAVAPFMPRLRIRARGERRGCGDPVVMYARKRKARGLVVPDAKKRTVMASDCDLEELGLLNWRQNTHSEGHLDVADVLAKDALSVGISLMKHTSSLSDKENTLLPLVVNTTADPSSMMSVNHAGESDETGKDCNNPEVIVMHKEFQELLSIKHHCLDTVVDGSTSKAIVAGQTQLTEPDLGPARLKRMIDEPALQSLTWIEDRCPENPTSMDPKVQLMPTMTDILETDRKQDIPPADPSTLINVLGLMGYTKEIGGTCHQDEGASLNNHIFKGTGKSAPEDQTDFRLVSPAVDAAEPTIVQKEPRKSFVRLKTMEVSGPAVGLRGSIGTLKDRRDDNPPKHVQTKKDIFAKQKTKRSHNRNVPAKENKLDAIPKASKGHVEPKLLPDFESFTIEEEEGSGGYGTVYRARRKEDGKIFAIKYPHANAHSRHIYNELKMLERFGGRNFVIKFEGSFTCDDSECFVLEHVQHDRPEVLKKEMDVLELQWYGFCMFRALASLHKQGIVHRDVKPGNFLFSRKLNKGKEPGPPGYVTSLVHTERHCRTIRRPLCTHDQDLYQKFCRGRKSETNSKLNDPVSQPNTKPDSYTLAMRRLNDGDLDNMIKEKMNNIKKPLMLKDMKKRSSKGHVDTFPSMDSKNKYGSQAADASGVTSTKDPTSTRTSGDRLKQPIPCKGRKELINFVHEAMQSPDQKAVSVPVSQRKRIAAPFGKMDRGLVILSPMPLHSGGTAVAGAGMFRKKGNGKQKREGPCVGTKGFRAPEVLFRSFHQSCKVDVWSAGVTLLYLIIGRAPFSGDPEQNIKEIAKLRGSEDLWEVAKLHNRESSFPEDLLEVQSLQSLDLREWCELNTRRPEFLELVPPSLFDLVDKCLTVNPRRRITAEEALMHSFFAPCHESLRKQRIIRRARKP